MKTILCVHSPVVVNAPRTTSGSIRSMSTVSGVTCRLRLSMRQTPAFPCIVVRHRAVVAVPVGASLRVVVMGWPSFNLIVPGIRFPVLFIASYGYVTIYYFHKCAASFDI